MDDGGMALSPSPRDPLCVHNVCVCVSVRLDA